MSKSRNMSCLYVPWSRANVIASAAYKQFSSLVDRGKMRYENPQRPLGSYNKTSQSNWFACLKNYQPINARGSDPDPVACIKVRFEAKVTRGFSLSPCRFCDSLSPLRGLLLISFAKKNQEKPLGPGYQTIASQCAIPMPKATFVESAVYGLYGLGLDALYVFAIRS